MKKKEIDIYINSLCVKYANTHPFPADNGEWLVGRNKICDMLPTELETGKTKRVTETIDSVDVDGNKCQITTSREVAVTTPFDAYAVYNKNYVRESLERAYAERRCQPANIPQKPDLRRWLDALKTLLFNVKDVKAAAKAVFNFVQAFHDSNIQTLLYLYSDKSGGTGKTWLGEQLKWYFNDYLPHGKAHTVTDVKDGYINPSDFATHMTFLDDFNPNNVEIETLNNLIDHHEMSYNIKFGPKGRFTNKSVIVASSNYLPKNVNSRRWALVEYNSYNVAHHIRKLDKEAVHKAVVNLFECCPTPQQFEKLLDKLASPDVSCLNYELLQHVIDHSERVPSRISDFVDGDQKKACQLANMLVDLQSKHMLPLSWKRTPVMMHKFNWHVLAEWIIKNNLLVWDEFDGDVLDQVAEEWDQLKAELCCDAGPEEPEPSKPDEPEPSKPEPSKPSSFKAFVDSQLTHFSDISHVSDSPQAQLCSNCVRKDGSKVTLHDTNEQVRPVVMAFESDTLSIEEQEANIKQPVWDAKVFSGNKSLHVLVQVPDDISVKLDSLEDVDKTSVYHRLYSTVAECLFKDTSKLDLACKSWLRKFRTPDGIRDNGKKQTAVFNDALQPLCWDALLSWAIETAKASERSLKEKLARKLPSKQRDVSADMRVRSYLDTPFTKMSGNGCSDSSLYQSMCVCVQANDDTTLAAVLEKAKSEKWTEKELARKLRDAKKLCLKRAS